VRRYEIRYGIDSLLLDPVIAMPSKGAAGVYRDVRPSSGDHGSGLLASWDVGQSIEDLYGISCRRNEAGVILVPHCAAAPVSDPATARAAPSLPSRSTTLRLV
jgi:hypothetical protein